MTTKSKKARVFSFIDDMLLNVVKIFPAKRKEDDLPLLTLSLMELPPGIRDRLALAGLRTVIQQRTSDIDAGPAKLAAMKEVFAHWANTGKWEKERAPGSVNRVATWMPVALAKMRGATYSVALRTLDKYAAELTKEGWEELVAKLRPYRDEANEEEETLDLTDLGEAGGYEEDSE